MGLEVAARLYLQSLQMVDELPSFRKARFHRLHPWKRNPTQEHQNMVDLHLQMAREPCLYFRIGEGMIHKEPNDLFGEDSTDFCAIRAERRPRHIPEFENRSGARG